MKKTFIFYGDRKEYTEEMTREEKGLFLECILDFQNGGNPDPGVLKFVRSKVKNQLQKDNEKRADEVKKRSNSGKLGGLAKSSKLKQKLASASKGKQLLADNVNDNVDNIIINNKLSEDEIIDRMIKELIKDSEYEMSQKAKYRSLRYMIQNNIIEMKEEKAKDFFKTMIEKCENFGITSLGSGKADWDIVLGEVTKMIDRAKNKNKKISNWKNQINTFLSSHKK